MDALWEVCVVSNMKELNVKETYAPPAFVHFTLRVDDSRYNVE